MITFMISEKQLTLQVELNHLFLLDLKNHTIQNTNSIQRLKKIFL